MGRHEELLGDFLTSQDRLHAAEARIKVLEGENIDLHLVAQGIKHYWLCPNNAAAGNPDSPHVCVRCERDAALAGKGE